MTSAEWDTAYEEGDVCGARHPNLPVTCALKTGPNALTDVPPELSPTATADEVAAALEAPPVQVEVHVHKGMDRDGGTHRWEDQTAPEGGE